VIAIDTNILIYAHLSIFPQHKLALSALQSLISGRQRWGTPWPCVHEFCATVTSSKMAQARLSPAQAFSILERISEAPNFRFLSQSALHLHSLKELVLTSLVTGGAIHDARIAAICIENHVSQLWTADRDFSRFPGINVYNPLISR
jgi:uncharacterized protein